MRGHDDRRRGRRGVGAGQPVLGPALLAVGAPVVLFALSRMARTAAGVALGPLLLPGDLTVIPAHANFAAFSPTYLAV